jgi:hypothetical protein
MLQGWTFGMTATEPQSIAAVLALGLIALLATAAPAQVQPTPIRHTGGVSQESSPRSVHHYGILGAVDRPGVYVSVHDDLTLAELVTAAGGTVPRAARTAQVIRRGHTGPRLNCSPPSTARLLSGDVVVVQDLRAAENSPPKGELVTVALVGITPDKPVVLPLLPQLASVDQLIAALHQDSTLIESARILRPSAGPSPHSEEEPPTRLLAGDIVVFDPTTIDRRALAQAESFPPPVLIPERTPRTNVEMVIRPQQQFPGAGETIPAAATVIVEQPAAVEQSAEDVWSLSDSSDQELALPTSSPSPLELPESLPAMRASEEQPPTDEEVAASIEQTVEADDTHSSGESRNVLATSLVAAPPEMPPRSAESGTAAAMPEPERMAVSQGGAMLAPRGRVQPRPDLGRAAADDNAGVVQVAAVQAGVPTPSDPVRDGNSPGLGMRAVTLGITVLATALICLAASLLWSRLEDSTGLPGNVTGHSNEPLPIHSRTEDRSTLQRLINNALPIIEEPTLLPEGADFHGEAVGRRRLRIDAEQSLSGPHFAAPQRAPQSVAVPEAAGTANTRPKREAPPVDTPAGDATASSTRDAAQGGLLDRVLVAMERERRR